MKFLAKLDLYKAIILGSLLLLPVAGWWIMNLQQSIQDCERAIREAKKPGGTLEQIGTLQKKVRLVVMSQALTSSTSDPGTYFERQILLSKPGIDKNSFRISPESEEPAAIPGSKQKVVDKVVKIEWGGRSNRRDFLVQQDLINAVVFNCESAATEPGKGDGQARDALPSIWRLRRLTFENELFENAFNAKRMPPPELEDKWLIRAMDFARREPPKGAKAN